MQPMTVCSANVPKEVIETSSSTRHLHTVAEPSCSTVFTWQQLVDIVPVDVRVCVHAFACEYVCVCVHACVHEPTEHRGSIRLIAATACSSFLVYAVAHHYLVHGGVWPVGSCMKSTCCLILLITSVGRCLIIHTTSVGGCLCDPVRQWYRGVCVLLTTSIII